MDKKHEDALNLTKDELLAKLRAGRPAELADAPTVNPVVVVFTRLPTPTFLPGRPRVSA